VPDAAVRRQLLSIHRAGAALLTRRGPVLLTRLMRRGGQPAYRRRAALQAAFRRLTPQMSQVIGSERQISAAFPSLDSGKTLRATMGDPLDFRATPTTIS